MDANEGISNPQISSQGPMLFIGGGKDAVVFLCDRQARYAL